MPVSGGTGNSEKSIFFTVITFCQSCVCNVFFCYFHRVTGDVAANDLETRIRQYTLRSFFFSNSFHRFSLKLCQRSKANCLRNRPGAMFLAIIAASISKVPVPHIKSMKVLCTSHSAFQYHTCCQALLLKEPRAGNYDSRGDVANRPNCQGKACIHSTK